MELADQGLAQPPLQSSLAGRLLHSGQTHDTCAVPAIILQKKIQTNVESFTLTAKLNAVSENAFHFEHVFTSFIGAKFGLLGHFMYHFLTNFALVKV